MFHFRKTKKQMIALCLSAALSAGSLTAYAATEYWNDASTKPMVETKTPISDNTNWEQWKLPACYFFVQNNNKLLRKTFLFV